MPRSQYLHNSIAVTERERESGWEVGTQEQGLSPACRGGAMLERYMARCSLSLCQCHRDGEGGYFEFETKEKDVREKEEEREK